MFLKKKTAICMNNYLDKVNKIKKLIDEADAIVIGAGAGLSVSAGFTYTGERFEKYFSDYKNQYGIRDMYSGGFYPFKTLEEYWAWWSRHIYVNRYNVQVGEPYKKLLNLIKNKNYFVLTTNVDHQFQLAGFDKNKLFYTQGDYGLWQCSKACHNKTYDNEHQVLEMTEKQSDFKIPSNLIPRCPICNAPMTMNLRCDHLFVEDDGWKAAHNRYHQFLDINKNKNVVYLELGVGMNTPGIIKYPFWNMVYNNIKSKYICINNQEILIPDEIKSRSILIREDINDFLESIYTSF